MREKLGARTVDAASEPRLLPAFEVRLVAENSSDRRIVSGSAPRITSRPAGYRRSVMPSRAGALGNQLVRDFDPHSLALVLVRTKDVSSLRFAIRAGCDRARSLSSARTGATSFRGHIGRVLDERQKSPLETAVYLRPA